MPAAKTHRPKQLRLHSFARQSAAHEKVGDQAMSWSFLGAASWQFLITLWHVVPWLVGAGVVFSLLSAISPCNAGRPWWRKRGLGTDLAYWIFAPVFSRYLRIWVTVMGTMLFFGITDGQPIARFLRSWPWRDRPPAAMGARRALSGGDGFRALLDPPRSSIAAFCGNITPSITPRKTWNGFRRRAFIPSIWRWAPARWMSRLCLCGISPEVFIVMGPFNTIASVFVHANLDWTLGAVEISAGQPGLSSLASRQRGARQEFRQHLPAVGLDVRHLPYARRRAAGRLWHRRRGDAGRPDAADALSAVAGEARRPG